MIIITKPNKVKVKDLIKSEEWNKIVDGLTEIENILNNFFGNLDFGKVENIDSSKIGTYTFTINFNKTFTRIPKVFLSTENLDMSVEINYTCTNVSLTSFNLIVKVIRPRANTFFNMNWLAIA